MAKKDDFSAADFSLADSSIERIREEPARGEPVKVERIIPGKSFLTSVPKKSIPSAVVIHYSTWYTFFGTDVSCENSLPDI